MKRWEVAKGLQEGIYPIGTRFQVFYPDETLKVYVNNLGCLAWEKNEHHVSIAAASEDTWKVVENTFEDNYCSDRERLDNITEGWVKEYVEHLEAEDVEWLIKQAEIAESVKKEICGRSIFDTLTVHDIRILTDK